MLELLDSILAFSVIMLGISLLVTVIVQGLVGLMNLRGMALADGLAELFVQAKFDGAEAKRLASKILTHPLITDSILPKADWLTRWGHASAIRKEELLRFLAQAEEFGLALPSDAKARLEKAAGIISVWFDGQMDRVSQVFAFKARIVTIAVSFGVAFFLHLDAATLLERVFSDSEARAKLVASAESLQERAERLGVGEPSAATEPGLGTAEAMKELREIRAELGASSMDVLPVFGERADLEQGIHAPGDYFPTHGQDAWRHLLGIIAAGALLSLGAPFWFNLLKSLTNLRSVIAAKTDQEQKQKAA
jgi:hypothetical protein